ncbi:MAG: isoaspartyl peptidase/L-asparaginase [Flavobacteriaceae bacterium]|jgi:beta-aspartyl-peptidase (threonine type)|nr:isoaspartyl peptidase/L-asparaginase [Cryomorphaceae bacterium]MBL6678061.1 isoaspartyl peptidase/L-asparaginase [Flavobacteriaceae bacterium]MDA0330719.1 isoaspartyl peptidase/L-asparaginase [Bacteroidota bacterium]
MKKLFILLFVLLIISCSIESNENKIGIVIHGGAGTILKENMTAELENSYMIKLEEAVTKGYDILKNGGSSKDAVEQAIRVMEDSPLFNAGVGAVLTNDERVSLDASFMDGENLNAGAIAGSSYVKNPISAAIAVMEKSPHVLLSSKGADDFAIEMGIDTVPNSYFITERRLNSLRRLKDKNVSYKDPFIKDSKFGTVGSVAIDIKGNISAGTSTGGTTNKIWGRIGDVPIIGAGNYANNECCGISATGWGEHFIRNVVAYDIAAQIIYKNENIVDASKKSLDKVKATGGDGGVIGLDKNGNVAMEFNTAGMYRAHIDNEGNITIKIYKD